jgi:glycosyltransferase involved in cell wall biosynthesis
MISVCLTSFNGEKYIEEQIRSILIQLDCDDELIVSDDSSTDNTLEVVKSIKDKRIVLYENMKFKHYTPNFGFAISKAKGDYIFLSDQDDVWLPTKVNVMVNHLKCNDLVVSDCFVVDQDLNVIQNSFYNGNYNRSGFFKNFVHNHFLGCTLAFRRSLIFVILPFPKNILSHESWIGLNAEVFGKTLFINDRLILYRRHANNYSNTLKGSTLTFYQKLKYRFYILINILFTKFKLMLWKAKI